MYLKNLTILGFKSFADKTSLDFPHGITAIVGPNGCGKSNVADAIRWVLGEQSAKALRGGEMSDIIFNGTETRRPLSMAEVSLTIGDVDQEQLRAANLELLFNEVTVTRRIYRDGSNEYFLNRTACRLKDIQQLFLGTGVGRTSYSIMAQGHITQILSSRPEDRRMIFEEAAGITRFKTQKKEALRRLDQTEVNLGRISELVREIKRQIGSLQRQAGKARRYKALAADLKFLDTQLGRHYYEETSEVLALRREEEEKLNGEIHQGEERVRGLEGMIELSRGQMEELERELTQQQTLALETRSRVDALKKKIEFDEERISESKQRIASAKAEIDTAEEKKGSVHTDLEELVHKLEETRRELEEDRELLKDRTEILKGVDTSLLERQTALRNIQNKLFGVRQKLNKIRSEINSLDLQKQGNTVRLEKLKSELEQNTLEISELEERQTEFKQSSESDKQVDAEKKKELQRLQGELQRLNQEGAVLRNQQDELFRLQASRKSRLSVLEQLQTSREGFESGAQEVLKASRSGILSGALGALVDRMLIPQEYINAVELFLGKRLQLILVRNPEAAESVFTYLRNVKKGVVSLVPLSWSPEEESQVLGTVPSELSADIEKALTEDESKPIRLQSVIEAEESVQKLLRRLVGRAWLVPDLNIASRLWNRFPGEVEFVTLAGEVLSREGIFTGGSRKEVSGASSLLGRKNEIEELKRETIQLEQKKTELISQREALSVRQKQAQEAVVKIQLEIRSREVEAAARLGEYRALENSLRVRKQREETLNREKELLQRREAESQARRQLLGEQISEAEADEQSLSDNINGINEAVEVLRRDRDVAQNALTEVKIALAAREQFYNTHQLQKKSAENRLAELERLITQRRQEIDNAEQKIGKYQAEIEESRLQTEFQSKEYEQLNERLAELGSRKKSLSAEIAEREGDLKSIRNLLAQLQEQHGKLCVAIKQCEMTLQNISERMRERYQLALEEILPEPFLASETEEGIRLERPFMKTSDLEEQVSQGEEKDEADRGGVPASEQQSSEEEIRAEKSFPPIDWQSVAEMVKSLQERIDQMGPVNLVAIEEYEEIEQRHRFYQEQQSDLIKAKAHLLEVVAKINQQTREMFLETFEKIKVNFREMFATFFHGGYADLKLVDERDVLESGIDISVRPPGKQLKAVSLLSGGEQTMTAVALLFAIYQVKPSPFCVLDELDAPLDEANVDRFITVLKHFTEFSQFVVISHSKRTIAAANSIHGVTMPERGVSRMVSVKFRDEKGGLEIEGEENGEGEKSSVQDMQKA